MAKNNNSSSGIEKMVLVVLSLISLGLLVAIVYVWYNALTSKEGSKPGDFLRTEQGVTPPAQPESTEASNQTPDQVTAPLNRLIILSPAEEENFVVSKNLTVTGRTAANAVVVLSGGLEDVTVNADENGDFEATVALNQGENEIEVVSFDENGAQASQTINIVYVP